MSARWKQANALLPLRHSNYRRLLSGLVLTLLGSGSWSIFLVLQALSLNATAPALSSVVAWTGVGLFAAALAGGVVADRMSERKVLMAVGTVNLAVAAVITGLSWAGVVQLWHLSISAFLIGGGLAFFFPAYTALVPLLVPPADIVGVNGIEGATRPSVQQALAPAVTGALIGASVPTAGALMVTGSFALALACLYALPPDSPRQETEPREHPLRDLASGFRYIAGTPWLIGSVTIAAVMTLVAGGPIEVLLPTALRREFDNGATLYGFVVAALGIGGVVGSLVTGSLTLPRRYVTTMIGCWVAACLSLGLLAISLNPWVAGAALFVYGALIGAGMVIWGSLLQLRVPLEMLGRVASLDFFISTAFLPLSIALAGLLAPHISTTALFTAAAVIPLAAAGVVVRLSHIRQDELNNPLPL